MTNVGEGHVGLTVVLPGHRDVSTALRLAWGAATDTGHRRANNEDSFLARSPLFVVADGMGGHSAGDLASAAVIHRLAELVGDDFVEPRAIERALERATADISDVAAESESGVGTTVTGIALTMHHDEPSFAVFNIGDSRVYRFDAGELTQVTVDHSVVQELVDSGTISREQADVHPDSNIITRAVGFDVLPVADFWMIPVRMGLRMLICSDGLTKELSDDALQQQLTAGLSAQFTADSLIEAALVAGGRDNVTAIVVDVLEAPFRHVPDMPPDPDQLIAKPEQIDPDIEQTAPRTGGSATSPQ